MDSAPARRLAHPHWGRTMDRSSRPCWDSTCMSSSHSCTRTSSTDGVTFPMPASVEPHSVALEQHYVVFEQTGAIARITLDRPDKLNAINHALGLQLWEAFARCQEDVSIRAI